MSDSWEDFIKNEYGGPDTEGFDNPSVSPTEPNDSTHDEAPDDEDLDDELDDEVPQHTYATIDCGGDCGGCIALIVDNEIVSGPPFHPNCVCTLDMDDIENAEYQNSHLHQDVASNQNADTHDVKWLKRALVKLAYYTPDARAGESQNKLNKYPNQRLFDAIEKFRKENKIKETGAVKPGHWTEVKINEKIEQKETEEKIINTVFDKDVNIEPGQYATFDGKKLTVYQDGKSIVSWNAVSGRPGYQTPEHQDKKGTGPIPAGVYVARKKKFSKQR